MLNFLFTRETGLERVFFGIDVVARLVCVYPNGILPSNSERTESNDGVDDEIDGVGVEEDRLDLLERMPDERCVDGDLDGILLGLLISMV